MDIERTMQFILDQQAQFSSDIARINLVLLGSAERQRKFEETMLELEQSVVNTATTLERTNEILATLAARHIAIEDHTSSLASRVLAIEDLTSTLASRALPIEDLTAGLTKRQMAMGEFTGTLAERHNDVEQEMTEIRKTLLNVVNTQERTNGTLEILAQWKITTEQSLNALALTVERHVADHN